MRYSRNCVRRLWYKFEADAKALGLGSNLDRINDEDFDMLCELYWETHYSKEYREASEAFTKKILDNISSGSHHE